LVAKYVALIVPSIMPSRQMSAFRQSGHQRRDGAARSTVEVGADTKTITAMIATGTLQMTKLHCHIQFHMDFAGSIE